MCHVFSASDAELSMETNKWSLCVLRGAKV